MRISRVIDELGARGKRVQGERVLDERVKVERVQVEGGQG